MEDRKFKSKNRYLWSFVISTCVFILLVLASYSISYFELKRISDLQGEVAYAIFEDKLDYTLFEEGLCEEESFEAISRDLNFQGRIIDDLENKFGKDDSVVLFKKKFYTLVELEHLEFVNLLNARCDLDMSTILFFYSNEKGDLGRSEEVGRILDAVHSRNSDSLMIYSFDINLDSELIEKLKKKYNVVDSPSLVINEGDLVFNPQNIEDIEPHLEREVSVGPEGENGGHTIFLN